MGLMDELDKLINEKTPQQHADYLLARLKELDKAFEDKNLGIFQAVLKSEKKLIQNEGNKIDETLGLKGMQDVFELVKRGSDFRVANNLSMLWNKIGKWLH